MCVFNIRYIQTINTHKHILLTLKCILWVMQVFLPFSHIIPQKIGLFFCITFRSKERGTLGITFITITCCCCCLVAKVVSDSFATLWTVDGQVLLSMGLPRREYWSGMPFPSPGDLSDPEIKSSSLALAGGFFTTEPPGEVNHYII